MDRDQLLKAIRMARFALDVLHDVRDEKSGAYLFTAEENLLDCLVLVHGMRAESKTGQ